MKSKKVVSSLLVAAMATSLLAGCGGKDAPQETASQADTPAADTKTDTAPAESTEKTDDTGNTADAENTDTPTYEEQTLKVAAFEGGYGADMWSEVVKAFEASHPGVTVELTIDKKLEDVISPAMKAGDYPDVVHLATGREAALTETLTKENALLPLTDVLDMTVPGEDVKVKDKIIPGFLDTLATNPYGDGVTYYAPMFYSPCGLFFNSCMTYEDGIWESADATKVFDLVGQLAKYTEGTTVANANNDNFTKNQQLILDNKAIFCPNGTWLPGEMADAPRADGFEWGFMAIPAVNAGGAGCSFCWFEQMWIPAAAQNQDMAKEFVAYMYSDEAAAIFAKSTAIQPITGVSESLEGDNKMFYSIYDNGATAVMGGFASTAPVEGVNMLDTLCGTVNSIVSGDKTVAEWQAAVEEVSDKLRAAME